MTNVFGSARKMVSLALSGFNVKAGHFNKITSGSSQPVTGVEFQPSLVALASFQSTTMPNNLTMGDTRLGFGASDGTSQHSSAFSDTNALGRTVVWSKEDTTNAFIKSNNQTLTVEASATVSSFDADGFTLNWGTNDAVATEILYLAFAPLAVTAVELTELKATRYDSRVLVEWRTGYEVDNLGFNMYREIDGQRTRVNPSLVAGSGLMAGQGTATRGEQRYAVWDQQAADRSAVSWLEDLDFNGTRTMHGRSSHRRPTTGLRKSLVEAFTRLAKQLKRRGSCL